MKKKINCDGCSKKISVFPYQLKIQKRFFCGRDCYNKYQTTRPILNCKICLVETSKTRKYCDKCLPIFAKEQANKIASLGGKTRWAGHEYFYTANGYVMTKLPTHPLANGRGYVYSHRIAMEKHLGRILKKEEVVHHKDGNKMNNDISNLVMFRTTAEHTTYHLLNGDVGKKTSRRKDDARRLLQSRNI